MISHGSKSEAGTYEEWRVHGQPGHGYPPYDFVWSTLLNGHLDPEVPARKFVDMVTNGPTDSGGLRTPWVDGPHLSHRTVTIGEWISADEPA